MDCNAARRRRGLTAFPIERFSGSWIRPSTPKIRTALLRPLGWLATRVKSARTR